MIFLISATALIVFAGLGKGLFGSLDSPFCLYSIAWMGMISLFGLNLVEYIAIEPGTWWAISTSFGAFLLGACSLGPLFCRTLHQPTGNHLWVDDERLNLLLWTGLLLSALGLGLQVAHLEKTMGVSLLWTDPVQARKLHSYIPYFGYLNLLNVPSAALATFSLIYTRRWHLVHALIYVSAFVSGLLTTDRTRLFYTVIWCFFVWFHAAMGSRWTFQKAVQVGVVVLTLICAFIFIGKHFERRYSNRYSDLLHFPSHLTVLADPYIYLTGSIPAFQELMARNEERLNGRMTLLPILPLIKPLEKELEIPSLQGELYYVPMELNTYSYLQQFFLDFGHWGLFFGPFFCGFFTTWIYSQWRRQRSFLYLYWASLMSFCLFISIFVNFFTQQATWFFLGLGWICHIVLKGSRSATSLN